MPLPLYFSLHTKRKRRKKSNATVIMILKKKTRSTVRLFQVTSRPYRDIKILRYIEWYERQERQWTLVKRYEMKSKTADIFRLTARIGMQEGHLSRLWVTGWLSDCEIKTFHFFDPNCGNVLHLASERTTWTEWGGKLKCIAEHPFFFSFLFLSYYSVHSFPTDFNIAVLIVSMKRQE